MSKGPSAAIDRDGALTVRDGDEIIDLGTVPAPGGSRRAQRMQATARLRAAGYETVPGHAWLTASDERSGARLLRKVDPPPRPVVEVPPSAPDPDVPAPAVGDVVMPREGIVWCGRPWRVEPCEVVNVHDYRPEIPECVVVIQPAVVTEHLRQGGHPVNPEHGAYVGLVDVTPVVD